MFVRPSTVIFSGVALAGIAAAVPQGIEARGGIQCNTGTLQCCNSLQDASSAAAQDALSWIMKLFGVNITAITGQVGLTCSGVSSPTSCNGQPVCCNGNSFNGAVVAGCAPFIGPGA